MLGENIKIIRRNKKIKSKDISKYLKVNQATYSKWENGLRDIPTIKIPEIAEYLDVSIDKLFGIDDSIAYEKYHVRHNKEVTYDILNYLINEWDGDTDSAVQLFACYASLPIDLRKEIATFCMVYFTESIDKANTELTKYINIDHCRKLVALLQNDKKK